VRQIVDSDDVEHLTLDGIAHLAQVSAERVRRHFRRDVRHAEGVFGPDCVDILRR